MELYHYGVKGMHWGVRRYQNPDGTRTKEGKEREVYKRRAANAYSTKKDVDEIIQTMSKDEKDKLGLSPTHNDYLTLDDGKYVIKRILSKDGDTPIAFFDLFDDVSGINTALGVRADDKYRNKGYAKKVAKDGMDWYERNKSKFNNKPVYWGVRVDNKASIKIAKDLGFEIEPDSLSDDKKWINYVKNYK